MNAQIPKRKARQRGQVVEEGLELSLGESRELNRERR